MNYTYSVDVIERASGQPVKQMDVIGFNMAQKAKRGLEINLNHSKYFVKVTKQD